MPRYLVPLSDFGRLGAQEITLTNRGVNIDLNEDVSGLVNYQSPQLGEGRCIPCIRLNPTGEYTTNGWRFVATIEHSTPENIIKVADNRLENSIPNKYKTAEKECEHCHTRRDRNATYLVFNEDTLEWKQVGKTCLKEYTGGLDADTCSLFANTMSDIRRLDSALSSNNLSQEDLQRLQSSIFTSMDYAKKKALSYVKLYGYQKGETPNRFLTAFKNGSIEDNFADSELTDIGDWLANTEQTDYIRRARTVWNKGEFIDSDAGLLTSAIGSYLRSRERDVQRQETRNNNLNNPNNVFAGNVGDRITFTIAQEPEYLFSRGGRYGGRYGGSYYEARVYKLIDERGRVYIWPVYNEDTE